MKNLGLIRVISGGQTGADIGGLRAAKKLNIPTGGWIPKGFKTENGNDPSLGVHYGLMETKNGDYPPRTLLNIKDADATLIFIERESRGSTLTKNICIKLLKPHWINPTVENIRMFVGEHEIRTLNIAGNRESVSPGLAAKVEKLLVRAIGDES